MAELAGFTAIDVLGQADYWVPIVGGIATVGFYAGLFSLAKWLDGDGRGHDENHRGYGSDLGGHSELNFQPLVARSLPSRRRSPLKIDRRQAAELVYDLTKYASLNPQWTQQQRGFITYALGDLVYDAWNHDTTVDDHDRFIRQRMEELQAGEYRFKRRRHYEQALNRVARTAHWMCGQVRLIKQKEQSTGRTHPRTRSSWSGSCAVWSPDHR